MADDIVLVAETGRPTGSAASRRLRAQGKIPAVLYGPDVEATPLAVGWRELRAALTTDKGLNALLTLDVDGRRTKAIVKELQRHPVRRDVLHVDFMKVDVDVAITVDVAVVLEGEAEKVTREQGVVDQVLNALPITAKPDDIPAHIAVDISDLEIGDVITIGDLQLPPGVTNDADPEEPVATAWRPRPPPSAEGEEAAEGEEGRGAGDDGGE